MCTETWTVLLCSIWDRGFKGASGFLPGSDLSEWLCLIQSDYDEIDRIYVDAETIGV